MDNDVFAMAQILAQRKKGEQKERKQTFRRVRGKEKGGREKE
jgi:hypothetical protein